MPMFDIVHIEFDKRDEMNLKLYMTMKHKIDCDKKTCNCHTETNHDYTKVPILGKLRDNCTCIFFDENENSVISPNQNRCHPIYKYNQDYDACESFKKRHPDLWPMYNNFVKCEWL